MKKRKIIIIVISIIVALVAAFCIYKGVNAYYVNNGNSFRPATQEQIDALNACYEPLKDCKENGFDKEKAEELKPILKKALENGVTVNLYRKSDFYNKINDVSFSDIPIQDGLYDIAVAPVCYDSILAAYLGCVYATEPENLEKELEFLKKGVWILEPVPQFTYFFANYYNISIDDLEYIADTIMSFSNTIEIPVDKYNTMLFASNFVGVYIHREKGTDSEDTDRLKAISNDCLKQAGKVIKQIEDYSLNKIWIGYGENILVMD